VRRGGLALLAGALVLAAGAGAPLAQADIDPVRLTVTAPATARTGSTATVSVAVAADAGALDPRVGTLRVGVRLAPECGGSFATTSGPTVIDAVALTPQPAAGAAYAATIRGTATVPTSATLTACTYLVDDEGRQFATDTDSAVVVSPTGAVNPDGSGSGGGGAGAGSGGAGGACTPSLARAAKTVRRGAKLKVSYRACAKGRYRFALLRLDGPKRGRGKGRHHDATLRATGGRTTKLAIGHLARGRYRLVMVLPSGRHLRATRAVRVVAARHG